ncbi:MAG: transporter ATPase subunit [Clostridiales bacterium]|jgi:oligopeptide transport system ATP-binding protein|nr:transporter ATPase subunit [Clostridiales bacterium]
MAELLLQVIGLKKYFNVGRKQVLKAVDDVSFNIERGKTLGLVGESGCGKTTAGRTIIKIYNADGGQVLFKGKDILNINKKEKFALAKEMQMIFQDPYASLDPRKTVGSIIGEGLDIHKLYNSKEQREKRIHELLKMVGLQKEHINRFPHEFSGGQRQRVGIARALAVEPSFIICDEAISALDVSIQAQIINLLMKLQKELGLTYLFIAHDLNMVRHISDDTAVMYLGNLVEKAETEELFSNPMHPYTNGLLAAAPEADPLYEMQRNHNILEGEIASPINPKPGCCFCGRCGLVLDICREIRPELIEIKKGHFLACHRGGEF